MKFPLRLTFKIFALAPQIYVEDADGNMLMFVQQKLFRLKEKINVFRDQSKQQEIAEINADRVIDFSAQYTFTDPGGTEFGGVRRKGFKSLWKSHYDILVHGEPKYELTEANPFTKIWDNILGEIPLIGVLALYLFQPKYDVKDPQGNLIFQVTKKPSFFQRSFEIEKISGAEETADPPRNEDDARIVMAILMMVLLERQRG